jgi:hypothetical protein
MIPVLFMRENNGFVTENSVQYTGNPTVLGGAANYAMPGTISAYALAIHGGADISRMLHESHACSC